MDVNKPYLDRCATVEVKSDVRGCDRATPRNDHRHLPVQSTTWYAYLRQNARIAAALIHADEPCEHRIPRLVSAKRNRREEFPAQNVDVKFINTVFGPDVPVTSSQSNISRVIAAPGLLFWTYSVWPSSLQVRPAVSSGR